MDPTTTLFTFMLDTSHKTQSVQLVGSWDNFSKRYPMEKDDRKGRGQWRGCYSFKDICCDGDGGSSPKRNGGLKMGQTYWYYYELDDDTEIHDTHLPSTTTCPYLPGQPVNLLWVPIEVNTLRDRSASVGAMANDVKTMIPADRYMAPRAPPPTPRFLPRLNTSPAVLDRKRSARSVSPDKQRSPWSARALFGLKSPVTAGPDLGDRGRMSSPVTPIDGDSNISYPRLISTSARDQPLIPFSRNLSRDASPISVRKPVSRDPSPLRHPVKPENSMGFAPLTIPDEITEEDEFEDDLFNFASHSILPDPDQESVTCLSPPPSRRRDISPPTQLKMNNPNTKPLPMLPATNELSPVLLPSPLRFAPRVDFIEEANLPRSHFSVDTMCTGLLSPTDSQSTTPSIYDSHDEGEGNESFGDSSFNFDFSRGSGELVIGEEAIPRTGFHGYSLPNGEYSSEQTLRKGPVTAAGAEIHGDGMDVGLDGRVVPRAMFDAQAHTEVTSALDQFLADMGYLGDVIVGK